ncbi:Uncharacterised protein r2_g2278 [Pycnogonum litorale]
MACSRIAFSAIILFMLHCLYMFAGIVLTAGWIIPLMSDPDLVQGDRRGFFQHTAYHDWFTLRVLLSSAGILLVCTSALGLIACVKKRVWMLMTASLFLSLSIGLQIAGGVKNATNKIASDLWSKEGFTKVMDNYWSNPGAPLSMVIDNFQISLECCGFYSYQDWNVSSGLQFENVPDNAINEIMPRSCCIDTERCWDIHQVYRRGCQNRITEVLAEWKSHIHLTHAFFAAVALLQVVGVVLGLQIVRWITSHVEKEERIRAIMGPTRL